MRGPVSQGGKTRQRAIGQPRMQARGYFWFGMALCVAGFWTAVEAGNHWPRHLLAGWLILGGVVIAARNARS